MTKHIPKTKLSKKARRAVDRERRGSWYGIKPVTRIVPSKKIYSRKHRPVRDED